MTAAATCSGMGRCFVMFIQSGLSQILRNGGRQAAIGTPARRKRRPDVGSRHWLPNAGDHEYGFPVQTVLDPATTYVDVGVAVAAGTVIYPNTRLHGACRIAQGCQIGPNSIIRSSSIGERSVVLCSVVEDSTLESDVHVGPYSHLRPGCYLERGVNLGNYAEAKASRIGAGTQMHHFGYLGDADVGARVNVGAGTITCNYDGRAKHATEIGDEAFIGSDSMLVAPLKIGRKARTGAGAVVTRDVADGVTVVGVPARALDGGSSSDTGSRAQKKDGE